MKTSVLRPGQPLEDVELGAGLGAHLMVLGISAKQEIKGPDNPTCVALCVRKAGV